MAQCKKCRAIRMFMLVIALLMIVVVNNLETLEPMITQQTQTSGE